MLTFINMFLHLGRKVSVVYTYFINGLLAISGWNYCCIAIDNPARSAVVVLAKNTLRS
jgi:hypothetical protein